mmetsp:Transcript_1482/g.3722  ORF Transcript_1482/g.3722 Transcript_1482/m.3722 type:complete len:261 (-) Transcript_1482:268-1050(-)
MPDGVLRPARRDREGPDAAPQHRARRVCVGGGGGLRRAAVCGGLVPREPLAQRSGAQPGEGPQPRGAAAGAARLEVPALRARAHQDGPAAAAGETRCGDDRGGPAGAAPLLRRALRQRREGGRAGRAGGDRDHHGARLPLGVPARRQDRPVARDGGAGGHTREAVPAGEPGAAVPLRRQARGLAVFPGRQRARRAGDPGAQPGPARHHRGRQGGGRRLHRAAGAQGAGAPLGRPRPPRHQRGRGLTRVLAHVLVSAADSS